MPALASEFFGLSHFGVNYCILTTSLGIGSFLVSNVMVRLSCSSDSSFWQEHILPHCKKRQTQQFSYWVYCFQNVNHLVNMSAGCVRSINKKKKKVSLVIRVCIILGFKVSCLCCFPTETWRQLSLHNLAPESLSHQKRPLSILMQVFSLSWFSFFVGWGWNKMAEVSFDSLCSLFSGFAGWLCIPG